MSKRGPARGFRYRLYFWLMDACFVFSVVGLTRLFTSPYEEGEWPLWYTIVSFIEFVFIAFVPLFLIFARFMRDDYAEGLLRRVLVVMGYVAAAAPALVIAFHWTMYLLTWSDGGPVPEWFRPYSDPMYHQPVARYDMIVDMWLPFMITFVGVFQFLRWRDSR